MEKEFIPYEEALALHRFGFDEPCFGYLEHRGSKSWIKRFKHRAFEKCTNTQANCITVPLYQQAFAWFRKEYGVLHIISSLSYMVELTIDGEFIRYSSTLRENRLMNSYEETQLACLKKLIEFVKEKR